MEYCPHKKKREKKKRISMFGIKITKDVIQFISNNIVRSSHFFFFFAVIMINVTYVNIKQNSERNIKHQII